MKRIIDQIKERADFVANLSSSISHISEFFVAEKALKEIINACRVLYGADSGCILIEKETGGFQTQVECTNYNKYNKGCRCCVMKELEGPIYDIIKRKEIFIMNLKDHKKWKGTVSDIDEIKYIIWSPLLGIQGKKGIIKLNFKEKQSWFHDYNDYHIMGLDAFTEHASRSMNILTISKEDRKKANMLRSLSDISDIFMKHTHNPDELLAIVAKEVTKALNVESCSIFLKKPKTPGDKTNYLQFKTGFSFVGSIDKNVFGDDKLVTSLLDENILKYYKPKQNHVFFTITNGKKELLIDKLKKLSIKDIDFILNIWNRFLSEGKNALELTTLPEKVRNRLIPICDGGPKKTLSGTVAYRKEKKNLFKDEIAADKDWGGIKHFGGYNYFQSDKWYSLLIFPLYVTEDEDALGVIKVENKIDENGEYVRFTKEDDEMILHILSIKITIAIKIANLMEELNNALLAKDQFLRTVSHTLQAPFHPIINYFEDIEEKYTDIVNDRAYKGLFTQTFRFKRHLNNLLTISKGKIHDYEKNVFPLHEIVDYVKRLFDFSLEKQNIIIDYLIDNSQHLLFVDKYYIAEVFVNILANSICAIKAKRRQKNNDEYTGFITFKTVKENSDLIFTIADNGIGIKEGEEEKIFQGFYSGTFSKGSIGIGLEVSKQYVEDHKGKIWVDEFQREGATMKVKLPLYMEDE